MSTKPSPWLNSCRRQPAPPTDFGTDQPGLALSPQRGNLLRAEAKKPRQPRRILVDEWAVGVVLLVFVVITLSVGLLASAWLVWGPK